MEPLLPEQRADEMLLMGLRLAEGLDLDRLARVGGVTPATSVIAGLEQQNLIERIALQSPQDPGTGFDEIRACLGPGLAPGGAPAQRLGRIRATAAGRFLLNRLVLELSAGFVATGHGRAAASGQ